jgi:hypothetical protein
VLAVAAGPVLRMSGIGLLGGGGIGFGERGLKRELVAGGFAADLGHGLFRAVCNRFCGSVSVWAEVSSWFLAAHMTDLAPLPGGAFSMIKETNGAAGRWGGGLAVFRRDRRAPVGKTHDQT